MGIAIGLHVLGVVWWIGGLAFVTLVFLPLARAGRLGDMQTVFQTIEGRFALQVKTALFIVLLSGLYMLWKLNAWSWFVNPHTWWLPAMVLYWLWFALMLFVLGPTGLLKRIMKGSGGQAEAAWRRLHGVHAVLLVIGLIIIAGAVAGTHGF
jgi:uncharacterized membrane protein